MAIKTKRKSTPSINTRQYWEEKFQTTWEANLGKEQTTFFMKALLDALPEFVFQLFSQPDIAILDWGCAMGQGVFEISKRFPKTQVTGLDCSKTAIAEAQKLYPDFSFRTQALKRTKDRFNLILTSNCLEHFSNPIDVLRQHLYCTTDLYILLVPFKEPSPMEKEHFFFFEENSFPNELGDFLKAYTTLVELNDPRFWVGPQMLVVYCSRKSERFVALIENFLIATEQEVVLSRDTGYRFNRQLTALNKEYRTMLHQMDQTGTEREKLRRDNEILLERISQMQERSLQIQSEYDELQTQIQSHQKKIQDLSAIETDVELLISQESDLQQKLEQSWNQLASERRGKEILQDRYEQAIGQLNSQLERLESERQQIIQDREESHQKLTDLGSELEVAKKSASTYQDQLNSTQIEMQKSWESLERVRREKEILEERLGRLDQGLSTQVEGLEKQRGKLTLELEFQNRERETTNRKLQESFEVAEKIRRERDILEERLQQLDQKFSTRMVALENEKNALTSELESQIQSRATLQVELESVKNHLAEQEKHLQLVQQERQSTEQRLQDSWETLERVRRQRDLLQNQVESFQNSLNQMQLKLQESSQITDQIRQEKESHKEAQIRLETQLSTLEEQRQSLQEELRLSQEKIENLNNQLIESLNYMEVTRTRLEFKRSRIQDLDTSWKDAIERLKQVRQSESQLAEQVKQLDHTVYDQRNQITQLEEQIHHSRNECEILKGQLEDLRIHNQTLAESLEYERNRSILKSIASGVWLGVKKTGTVIRHPLRSFQKAIRWVGATHYCLICWAIKKIRRLGPYERAHMSWYSYAYREFRKKRLRLYPSDLSSIQCPSSPGLVSIVLPVFNGEHYVAESIQSVLAQTYPNWELIVVNDGSTDRTAEILDRLAEQDSRIRVVHQENRKLPRSLSRGFRMARGEYLTWTSDDNRMKPDCLEILLAQLKSKTRCEMIYANFDLIGEDSGFLKNSDIYPGYQEPSGSEHIHLPRDISEMNYYASNPIGAAFLYRDRVAHLLGDYSPIRFTNEDYDYWLRCNEAMSVQHAGVDDPVYDYRIHSKSLSSNEKELKILESRNEMMVFDDFRRDLLFYPIVWILDESSSAESTEKFLKNFKKKVLSKNHVVLNPDCSFLQNMPRLWLPSAYLVAVDDLSELPKPPDHLPLRIPKILVYTGVQEKLPENMPKHWNLCVAISENLKPVRLKGEYQGWYVMPDLKALFTALDLRIKYDHAAEIEQEIVQPPDLPLRATFVICTYKRREKLPQAVRSCCEQTLNREEYEILIVNNDISDDLTDLIQPFREEFYQGDPEKIRIVTCPAKGLSFARNAGISEARGKVVLFIDDDALAEKDLLEVVIPAFEQNSDIGVLGGKIFLRVPPDTPFWFKPGLESYWGHYEPGYEGLTRIDKWYEYPWGGNWSARRDALVTIGGFRCRYGRIGKDFGGGEEVAASALINMIGKSIAFHPDAHVIHDPGIERITFKYLRKTILQGIFVTYQLQKDLYLPVETTFSYTFYLAYLRFKEALTCIRREPGRSLQYFLLSKAYLFLALRYVKDFYKRFLSPVPSK